MVGFYVAFSLLPLMGFTGQETLRLLTLHEPSPKLADVSVTGAELPTISSSVVAAERWVKTHVLAHSPSTRITTIVVGRGVMCNRSLEHNWRLVLPSVKNLYYSLVRLGLMEEIKLSVSLSSDCFRHLKPPSRFRGDLEQDILKPLLGFLQDSNLDYSIDPPTHSPYIAKNIGLVTKKVGFSRLRDTRLMREVKPMSKKPSSLIFPSFLQSPEQTQSARNRIPPHPRFASASGASISFVHDASPSEVPANPPDALAVPPLPSLAAAAAPAPGTGEEQKGGLWCVAKPTVPAGELQEAMDYACGEGAADCEEIKPNGGCYYPDNAVAHASFAFNSYWQKSKHIGGSCSFDGRALLINSDPSFLRCRFVRN